MMRLRILLSLVVIAFGLLAWKERRQIAEARVQHRLLDAEAAALGVSSSPHGLRKSRHYVERKRRERVLLTAYDAAAVLIECAYEMDNRDPEERMSDPDFVNRLLGTIDALSALETSGIEQVIGSIRNEGGLGEETRRELVQLLFTCIAEDSPRTVVDLLTNAKELMAEQDDFTREGVLGDALSNWAGDDPLGALEWLRKNGRNHPWISHDDAAERLLCGVAVRDSALAFQLIGELFDQGELEVPSDAITKLSGAAGTVDERIARLAALRSYVESRPTDVLRDETFANCLRSLAFGNEYGMADFKTSTGWLDSAGLSTTELSEATSSMQFMVALEDSGRWIEWLGRCALPEEVTSERIRNLVSRWTREDYRAAGEWLAGFPDGPQKENAVRAYDEALSSNETEIIFAW